MTVPAEQRVLHVLVVEGDRMLAGLVELILKRKGWSVTCAPDRYAALDLLRTDLPDVLLLDFTMPETSGFDVLDWIEETNPSWLPHVIVFTAASSKVVAEFERKHPSCRILRKPFDIAELVDGISFCAAVPAAGREGRSNHGNQACR